MANKKINELVSRTPSLTDLMLIGDPSSGYSYKTTVNDIALEVENIVAGSYVTLATAQTISGAKTFSNVLTLTSVANAPTAGTKFLILNASNVVNYRTAAEVLSDIGAQAAGSYVPTSRTLTINGTAYDLSADRTWSVGTVTSVSATAGTGISISGSPITSSGTLTITNTAPDQTVVLTSGTGINVTGTYPSFTIAATNNGTVTSVALATGTTGTDISVSGSPITSSGTITLNIPTASATNRGALSSTDWSTFNNKQGAITLTTTGSSGAATFVANTLNIPNYTLSGLGGVPTSRTLTINGTAYDLSADRSWSVGTVTSVAALTLGTTGTDLSSSVATGTTTPVITLNVPTASATNRGALSSTDWTTFNNKQNAITLTTTGTSGAATLVGATLNIPNYTLAGLGGVSGSGTTNYIPKFTGSNSIGNSLLTDDGTTLSYGSNIASIGATNTSEKYLQFNYTAGNFFVGVTTGENYIYGTGSKPITFYTNGSERMRLDASGNLLVATTSPSYNAAGRGNITIGGSSTAILSFQTGGTDRAYLYHDATNLNINNAANGALLFGTNNSTKATLTASGNLGLGVTPSAWSIVTPILQIGAGGAFIGGQGSANILRAGVNVYFNGSNWIYTNSDFASYFETGSGAFKWFTAPSGTAGNAISFTQAMTLDASGRLAIGLTSPVARLHIENSASADPTSLSSVPTTNIFGMSTSPGGMLAAGIGTTGGTHVWLQGRNVGGAGVSYPISLQPLGGNVGIGTTSPAANLHVSNTGGLSEIRNTGGTSSYKVITGSGFTSFGTITSDPLVVLTNDTERMRITSGGNVGIGTSSPNSTLHLNGSFTAPLTTKTANYTLTSSDYTVGFDCAADRTATLPDATTCSGRIYVIYQYNTAGSTRGVTIDPNGAQTINGAATYLLKGYCEFSSVMIQSNGSNWIIISDALQTGCL